MAKAKKESAKKDMFAKCKDCPCYKKSKCRKVDCGGGAVYGLGLIGALVYFFQNIGAVTFGSVVMAIIKSIFWPAFVIYKVLEFWKF